MPSITTFAPALVSQGSFIDGFKLGNIPVGILTALAKLPLASYKNTWGYLLSTLLPVGTVASLDHVAGTFQMGDITHSWDVTKFDAFLIVESSITPWITSVPVYGVSYPTGGYSYANTTAYAGGAVYRSHNAGKIPTEIAIASNLSFIFIICEK